MSTLGDEVKPRAFILMNKRNGEIMAGYRVTFTDHFNEENEVLGKNYSLIMVNYPLHCDGWVVQVPPGASPVPLFLKREWCEENLEILDEL